jgi:hypothetical protein
MKVELLRLDTATKPSPISEGVAEIRIDSQPCKGINLTTQYTWATKAPRAATVHEAIRSHLTLVHAFHTIPRRASVVAHALSQCTPIWYGRITSVSMTHDATTFAGAHKSRMRQYIIKSLFNRAQPTWALIDTGGGYHLGAPNLWSKPHSALHIQYSPLSPNCPAWSQVKPFYQLITFSIIPFTNQGIKSSKSHEWNLPLDFYWSSIH